MRNYASPRAAHTVSVTAMSAEESIAVAMGLPFAKSADFKIIEGRRRNVDVMDPKAEFGVTSEDSSVIDSYEPVEDDVILENEAGELSVVKGYGNFEAGDSFDGGRWLLIEDESGCLAEVHEGQWSQWMTKASRIETLVPILAKIRTRELMAA